jgi:hypothetical protein
MKTVIKGVVHSIFLVFIILTGCRPKAINVSDSFDKPGLSSIWSTDRMETQSFEIQSKIVHNGTGAAKITLRSKDTYEPSMDGDKPTERDELREATTLFSVEDQLYDYRFSMFLPDTFPIVPVRLVIAQWKEYCNGKDSCSNDSPVVALRYVSDTLLITLNAGKHAKVLYKVRGTRDQWLDFDFLIRFTRNEDGIIVASINNKEVVNYKGVTSYLNGNGYRLDKNRYYFKMGLYRDLMPEPMCIYIDDYSKKEISIK